MEGAVETMKTLITPKQGKAAANTMLKGVLNGQPGDKVMQKVGAAISPDAFQEEEIHDRFKESKKLRKEFDAKKIAVLTPLQKEHAKRLLQEREPHLSKKGR
jgi:hypothetical protein